MTELMTTDSAARIAENVDFPELVEMLQVAKASNVDFVNIVPNDAQDDVIVSPATGVMVAWMLPEDDAWDLSLAVEGGTTDHHITLVYLGEAADLDLDAQRTLIAVTAEVCQRHVGVKGTIQGTGSFDNETETVWYADVHIDQLAELQADLATSLIQAGLPVATDYDFTPHMTLAYLPPGSGEPTFDVAEFDAVISSLTVAIGGSRFDLPLQDIDWEDEEPPIEYVPPIRTPFIPRIDKALGDVDNDTTEEWRYTLGPVYMPGMVDAHGDSINADDLEHAIHDYVRSGNRDIHLQHEPDVIAGEWVGLLVWPWAVTVPVVDEGRFIQRTFPAGTPFMGVVWTPEVWELVKAGEIRGYSLGGMAQFVTVDFGDDADVAKFNPNHDARGRFGQGAGVGGEVITPSPTESRFGQNPKVDARISPTKIIGVPTRRDSAIHQAIYDAPKANYTLDFQETVTKRAHTGVVIARLDGKQVGHLDLHDRRDPGKSLEVGFITTDKDFQRQGIATAMLDFARRDASLPVHHSSILTSDGKAFTDVVKFNPNHDAHGRFAPGEGSGFVHDVRQPDGGFTFNPVTGASASSGYAVSPYPERSQMINISKMSDKAIRSAVNDYGAKNKDIITKPGVFIGGWHDPENRGKVYLDISVVTKTATAAKNLALKHDQIAYFDFQTFQSVTVNKDAKSGQG